MISFCAWSPATTRAVSRAALALYPGCGLQGHFKGDEYVPYAPLRVFIGTRDEEVSLASPVQKFTAASKAEGGDITITVFEGATHDFDDPGRERQGSAANVAASTETRKQAIAFLATALGRLSRGHGLPLVWQST